jgi:hypothetical protein
MEVEAVKQPHGRTWRCRHHKVVDQSTYRDGGTGCDGDISLKHEGTRGVISGVGSDSIGYRSFGWSGMPQWSCSNKQWWENKSSHDRGEQKSSGPEMVKVKLNEVYGYV